MFPPCAYPVCDLLQKMFDKQKENYSLMYSALVTCQNLLLIYNTILFPIKQMSVLKHDGPIL